MWFKKKQIVPKNNETKTIDVVKTWVVSWDSAQSSHGLFYKRKEFVACLSKEEALSLRDSLKNAFALCKDSNRDVHIEER